MKNVLILLDDGISLVNPIEQEEQIRKKIKVEEEKIVKCHLDFDGITNTESLVGRAISAGITNIICYRLRTIKRVAPDMFDVVQLIAELTKANINLYIVQEELNTEDDLHTFIVSLVNGWKQSIRTSKKENPQVNQLKAKLKGKSIGRQRKRNDAEIIKLFKEGVSIRQISFRSGVSRSTVLQALKDASQK